MSYGPPPNPPPWGQPPTPYDPSPYAPSPYGPPPGPHPAFTKLESDTQTWIIVAAVGWFFGLMWVTGPIAWYQSKQIANQYAQLGAQPPNQVNVLRLIGMITTILVIVAFAAACVFGVLGLGLAFFANAPRH